MVWLEFMNGKTPSEIDRDLGLAKGTARYEVTCIWARDKEGENGIPVTEG